ISMSRIAAVRPVGHIGQRNVRRRVGPEHAAHHLVRSGQRMPVPSKELGWELSGVVAYLWMGPAHDTNPTDTCRTQYSSAINGTDGCRYVAQGGHSRHILLFGLRRLHGSAE